MAKSEYGRFIPKIIPRAILAIGGGASAIGLTAGIEDIQHQRRITLGAYGMANGDGCVIIDELDKRKREDFEQISIPLDENQMIKVDKAGFHRPVPARCASWHIANPKGNGGRWDITKTIEEQTAFPSWLLSKYDLVMVVSREMSPEFAAELYTHQMSEVDQAIPEEEYRKNPEHWDNMMAQNAMQSGIFSIKELRYHIKYLREHKAKHLKGGTCCCIDERRILEKIFTIKNITN